MRSFLLKSFPLFLFLSASSAFAVPGGWSIFWSDEFNQADNSAPNPANWGYDTGCSGWGNAEWENYTNSTQNSFVTSDGAATDGKALVLKAISTGGGSCGYTSARLLTSGKQTFQYGWIEARMKLPYGQGIWPAFWMLGTNIGAVGWPTCGEIDVMENIGKVGEQGRTYGTIHGPGYSGGAGISANYNLPGGTLFKDGYHTFAVNWQMNQLDFYVDDILYASRTPASIPAGTTWVYNAPFFMILNLAVGGGWPGYPDGTTVFPQELRVDYVRVYHQGAPVPTATPTRTPTPVVASTWRVNSGGPSYMDGAGNTWSADTNFTGGAPATVASAINGTTDDALYQTERYGNPFTYTFNVPAGNYQVTLKFAETYTGITAAGQRVFNVSINGAQVLTNLDIFAEVGLNTADDKVFNNISPVGGTITIQFGPASVDNAKSAAIQIIPMPATPTFTRTASMTPTASLTATPTASPTRTFTPANTATFTPTRTNTSTNTPSRTPTASATSTATFTNTAVPPTNTSTRTSTSTNTPTRTSTVTFTNTVVPPTNTPTRTFTPTSTYTVIPPTNTPSRTPTATFTNTAVPPTNTPTRTNTSTTTSTPIASTNTPTRTNTATNTNTAIPPTNTATSTNTNTPVPSTNTPTRTNTSTAVPPTASMTSTISLTATPSATRTFTNTNTATSTNTAIPPTNTLTSTLTRTPTSTFSPTATATRTSTASTTPTPSATLTATLSASPTSTSTNTWTLTPTASSTSTASRTPTPSATATAPPIGQPTCSYPYPNPSTGEGPVKVDVYLPGSGTVVCDVLTTAFRRVWSGSWSLSAGKSTVQWDLRDGTGSLAANGLYYLRVRTPGSKPVILKVSVNR